MMASADAAAEEEVEVAAVAAVISREQNLNYTHIDDDDNEDNDNDDNKTAAQKSSSSSCCCCWYWYSTFKQQLQHKQPKAVQSRRQIRRCSSNSPSANTTTSTTTVTTEKHDEDEDHHHDERSINDDRGEGPAEETQIQRRGRKKMDSLLQKSSPSLLSSSSSSSSSSSFSSSSYGSGSRSDLLLLNFLSSVLVGLSGSRSRISMTTTTTRKMKMIQRKHPMLRTMALFFVMLLFLLVAPPPSPSPSSPSSRVPVVSAFQILPDHTGTRSSHRHRYHRPQPCHNRLLLLLPQLPDNKLAHTGQQQTKGRNQNSVCSLSLSNHSTGGRRRSPTEAASSSSGAALASPSSSTSSSFVDHRDDERYDYYWEIRDSIIRKIASDMSDFHSTKQQQHGHDDIIGATMATTTAASAAAAAATSTFSTTITTTTTTSRRSFGSSSTRLRTWTNISTAIRRPITSPRLVSFALRMTGSSSEVYDDDDDDDDEEDEDALTDEQIEEMYELYEIPRTYRPHTIRQWERMFRKVVRYAGRDDHDGRFRPPRGTKLGNWCNGQRWIMSKGALLPYRVQKLNEIGFKWTVDIIQARQSWEAMFKRLDEYKNNYGHTNVPIHYPKDETLGTWAYGQVYRRRTGSKALTQERIKKLDSIGFDWNYTIPTDDKWDEKYDRLVEYWKKKNSTIVPRSHEDDPELGTWGSTQRNQYNTNDSRMTPDRIEKLEAIGFVWNAQEAAWLEIYNRLVEYRQEEGDADVPYRHKKDPKLGTWVDRQRKTYKKGKLSPDRIEKLEEIGFKWSVRRPSSE